MIRPILLAEGAIKDRDLEIKRLQALQPRAFGWAAVCGPTVFPDFTGNGIQPAFTIGCTWGFGLKNPHWPGRHSK